MYNLVNVVARLDREGDRNGKAWVKIKTTVDQLADFFSRILPGGGFENKLPDGYVFKHWPSKEYWIQKIAGSHESFSLTRDRKGLKELLAFCEDIHTGWLNRVADRLNQQSTRIELAADEIATAQGPDGILNGESCKTCGAMLKNGVCENCGIAKQYVG